MEHSCPICQRALERDDRTKYVDYHCSPPKEDHHYAKRVSPMNELLKVKARISHDGEKMFLKLHYDEGYCQVWTNPDDDASKIRINSLFEPDFSDLTALKTKLRTYLVFS